MPLNINSAQFNRISVLFANEGIEGLTRRTRSLSGKAIAGTTSTAERVEMPQEEGLK